MVIFNSLTKENLNQIIDIEMKGILRRIKKEIGYSVKISEKAQKDFISEKGYDRQFG